MTDEEIERAERAILRRLEEELGAVRDRAIAELNELYARRDAPRSPTAPPLESPAA